MIRILLLDRYQDTVQNYLQTWARSLDRHVRCIAYETLRPNVTLRGGTFIFSDLERLTDDQCDRASAIAAAIEAAGGLVLNYPSRVLRRHSLLRSLHQSGDNPFNIYREHELTDAVRFPVFIRRERAHDGALSPLLKDINELKQALADLKKSRPHIDDWLIVEYLHTANPVDGLFRKHSAFRIGRHLIPRHILFSTDWVDKSPDVVNDQLVAEENDFLNHFPHTEQVLKILTRAGIDYGRIDYSILNGQVVTWEINTNPVLVPLPEQCHPARLAGQSISSKLINEALVDLVKTNAITVRLAHCQPILESSTLTFRRQLLFTAVRLWTILERFPVGRRLTAALARSLRLARDITKSS